MSSALDISMKKNHATKYQQTQKKLHKHTGKQVNFFSLHFGKWKGNVFDSIQSSRQDPSSGCLLDAIVLSHSR